MRCLHLGTRFKPRYVIFYHNFPFFLLVFAGLHSIPTNCRLVGVIISREYLPHKTTSYTAKAIRNYESESAISSDPIGIPERLLLQSLQDLVLEYWPRTRFQYQCLLLGDDLDSSLTFTTPSYSPVLRTSIKYNSGVLEGEFEFILLPGFAIKPKISLFRTRIFSTGCTTTAEGVAAQQVAGELAWTQPYAVAALKPPYKMYDLVIFIYCKFQ